MTRKWSLGVPFQKTSRQLSSCASSNFDLFVSKTASRDKSFSCSVWDPFRFFLILILSKSIPFVKIYFNSNDISLKIIAFIICLIVAHNPQISHPHCLSVPRCLPGCLSPTPVSILPFRSFPYIFAPIIKLIFTSTLSCFSHSKDNLASIIRPQLININSLFPILQKLTLHSHFYIHFPVKQWFHSLFTLFLPSVKTFYPNNLVSCQCFQIRSILYISSFL